MAMNARDHDAQDGERVQRVLGVNRVRNLFVPAYRLFHTHPPARQFSVFISRQDLQRAHQKGECEKDGRQSGRPPVQFQVPEHVVGANAAGGQRRVNRDLVMTRQPRHPEKYAGQGGAGHGPDPGEGPPQEQEHERRPDRAIEHLRPVRGAHVTAQTERQSRKHRRAAARTQVARQPVGEKRGHEMHHDEIPVQPEQADPAVAQRAEKQQPVQRVGYARLRLSDERLPAPQVGVPEGNNPFVPLAGLELEPGQHLIGQIRAFQPGVLVREYQLPVEGGGQQEQDQGDEQSGGSSFQPCRWCNSSKVVVFGRRHRDP
jgi:hypothetical protein